MYLLMFSTILNSGPKLITYLVSKTWVLMSFRISSKIFFGNVVCVVNWIGCLLIIDWFIGSGKPTQSEWSGPLTSTGVCGIESPPYNPLIMWTKESHPFFNLPINCCFCFHWFTFYKHLLFWYLTTSCDGSDYINWYIIKLKKFHHYSSSGGWFSLKHVLNSFFNRTVWCTMLRARTNNVRIY